MTETETLCYLAGAIDSDGTIGVKRSTYAMRNGIDGVTQATYSERVAFRQVTPEVVDLLVKTFGGSSYMTKPNNARGRPLFSWQATDMKAAICLRLLLPFLRVKKRQARNALALRSVKDRSKMARVSVGRGHAGSAARSEKHGAKMEAHYLMAKRLNAVGADA